MKHSGDYAELKFMVLMTELGNAVSKPISNNYRYDFIVDYGNELSRVQVKSTRKLSPEGCYKINVSSVLRNGRIKYSKSQIDEFYVYIIDINEWYRIPIEEIDAGRIRIYPDNESGKGKYFKYKLNERGRTD